MNPEPARASVTRSHRHHLRLVPPPTPSRGTVVLLRPDRSAELAAEVAAPQPRSYAAARSRAFGPTTALWHAVEVHRRADEVDDACELTVCGVLARIISGEPWPTTARDVCPVCAAIAR